jgi:tRNA pseudouridine55 synthase
MVGAGGRSARDPSAAILLVDKPAGMTSHDVVRGVRREREVKAGHAGTLDPFATGLLLVLLGPATRLQRYFQGLPKTYLATARLGWRSSTGDPDGELTETGVMPERLELPLGTIGQRLPMTSAARMGGERLYRKAHRGERVETPEREVRVLRAELLRTDGERAEFEIECSAGTYVRSLIETLDDAYCEALRRTAVGPLRVEEAGGPPLSPERALDFLPARTLSAEEARLISHGGALAPEPGREGAVRLLHDGRLVAVGRHRVDRLQPEVVLRPASG